ncbi:trypsin [Drosophila mojavensis]|uniref:trypsin n=1 Tax=Drosophila mojavensis TaxID=7230 RepID=B4KPB4_DROMO|nr:trypsin [Drosophila mojavensis]EDW09090.1 uncharacterized protein Dmoj_GI20323 [Drosophila mojavensis]
MHNCNCSVIFSKLLLLLLFVRLETNLRAESKILRRTKRLTSPILDDRTHAAAKYVVSIRSRAPQIRFGDNHYCVGTIIAPRYVVTAATCTMSTFMVPHQLRSIVVVGGTPNRLIRVASTVVRSVQKITVSKNFTKNFKHNIAVLRLTRRWPTDNPNIDIVQLPKSAPNFSVEHMVFGWGRLYRGGPLSGNLLHICVTLLDHEACEKILQVVHPETICAGRFEVGADESPCAGDTGAPLMANNTLVGIVSQRLGCGAKAMPSLYTDVWYHIDFINDTLHNASSRPTANHTIYILLLWLLVIALRRKYTH